jgi:hypothetical protein
MGPSAAFSGQSFGFKALTWRSLLSLDFSDAPRAPRAGSMAHECRILRALIGGELRVGYSQLIPCVYRKRYPR